jgi:serine/threonine-protein kinase
VVDTDRGEDQVKGRPPGVVARVAGWVVPALDPALREPFEVEVAAQNRRRLLVIAGPVLLMHGVHVALYRTTDAQRHVLSPQVARWGDSVALVHAITFAITATLVVLLLRWGNTRPGRWLAPAAVLTYLLHGAVIAGVDQISTASGVAPFIGYCLFMGVVVTLRPAVAMALYSVAAVVFVEAILVVQSSRPMRTALLPNGLSVVIVSLVMSWMLYASRRREFAGQATIRRQREVLGEMNASLERRVQAQVSEIVTRAAEVDRLNAQLQAKVRERSTELSMALAKLAEQRDGGGRLRPGRVLGGRFEIAEVLGEGGMGVVYAGIDRTSRSRVAIKVVQARSSVQLDALHRFLREATAAATVAHPAIVRVLHVDVSEDGMLFQAQELVAGVTLHSVLHPGRPWEAGRAARLGSVLCEALAAAHARGIVHRDVKPSNVMLTPAPPGLKLLDFGIAKVYDLPRGPHLDTRTDGGAILGTPAYMAPEQVEGTKELTVAADVYAAGVVLFELLAGRHPFDEKTPWGIAYSHMCVDAPDVRTLSPGVPTDLAAIVEGCLRKAPGERPTSADLARRLGALADAYGASTSIGDGSTGRPGEPSGIVGPRATHGMAAAFRDG